jgi:hypothetical protein
VTDHTDKFTFIDAEINILEDGVGASGSGINLRNSFNGDKSFFSGGLGCPVNGVGGGVHD